MPDINRSINARFVEGDIVNVVYNFPYTIKEVEIIAIPRDVGDFWYFQPTDGSSLFAQNPTAANLSGLELVKRHEDW